MKTTILQQDPPFIIKVLEYLPGGVTLEVGSDFRDNYAGIIPAGLPVLYIPEFKGNPARFCVLFPLDNRPAQRFYRDFDAIAGGIGLLAHSVYASNGTAIANVLTRGVVNARMLPELPEQDDKRVKTWRLFAEILTGIEFQHLEPNDPRK